MNANELADKAESMKKYGYTDGWIDEVATMLRQKQVRIKQLEETQEYLYKTHDKDKAKLAAGEQYCLDAFERGKQIGYADGMMNGKDSVQNIKQFTEHEQRISMNNEPYGWHCFIGKGKEEQDFLFINGKGASKPDASWDKVIPLYTHPVKEQLTDEKIDTIVRDFFGEVDSFYDFRLVIRRCIRKAQEWTQMN